MPWAGKEVFSMFEKLVKRIVLFHEQFGKNRNQASFAEISILLDVYLDALTAPHLPGEKDTNIRRIALTEEIEKRVDKNGEVIHASTLVLYQKLLNINNEKLGKSDNRAFNESLMQIAMLSALTYSEVKISIKQEVEKTTTLNIEDVEELNTKQKVTNNPKDTIITMQEQGEDDPPVTFIINEEENEVEVQVEQVDPEMVSSLK